MLQGGALLLSIAGLLLFVFFAQIPGPETSFEPLDYMLRSFFHADVVHLLANLLTLSRLQSIATVMTTAALVRLLIFLTLSSSLILFAFHALLPHTKVTTVGFSGVLVGLIVVKNIMFGGDLQTVIADILIQITPDLLEPRTSFLGHFSGAVAGLLYVFIFEQSTLQRNAVVLKNEK